MWIKARQLVKCGLSCTCTNRPMIVNHAVMGLLRIVAKECEVEEPVDEVPCLAGCCEVSPLLDLHHQHFWFNFIAGVFNPLALSICSGITDIEIQEGSKAFRVKYHLLPIVFIGNAAVFPFGFATQRSDRADVSSEEVDAQCRCTGYILEDSMQLIFIAVKESEFSFHIVVADDFCLFFRHRRFAIDTMKPCWRVTFVLFSNGHNSCTKVWVFGQHSLATNSGSTEMVAYSNGA